MADVWQNYVLKPSGMQLGIFVFFCLIVLCTLHPGQSQLDISCNKEITNEST